MNLTVNNNQRLNSLLLLLFINTMFCFGVDKTSIVVSEINNIGKVENEYLNSITEMIKLRLSLESNIEIIQKSIDEEQLLNYQSVNRKGSYELETDEIEYILSGNYRIIDQDVILYLKLFNRIDQNVYYFTPKPFKAKELLKVLDNLTEEIIVEMLRGSEHVRTKLAGIKSFNFSKMGNEQLSFLADELRYLTYINLPSRYSVIPLKKMDQVCASDDKTEQIKALQLDIIISADIDIENDELTVSPMFKFVDLNDSVTLVPYKTSFKGDSYEFYNDFSVYINKGLNAVLNPDFTWNIEKIDQDINQKYNQIISELERRYTDYELDDYKTLELVAKALILKPRKADPYYYRGLILLEQGNQKDALVFFDKAIELDKKFNEAYIAKGTLLFDLGLIDEALKTYIKGNQILDDNYLRFLIGEVYFFMDSTTLCIKYLETVGSIADKQEAKDYYLGECYYAAGKDAYFRDEFESSIHFLSKSLALLDNIFEPFSLLVKSYNRLGDYSKSDSLIKLGLSDKIINTSYFLDNAQDLRNIKDSTDSFISSALYEATKYLKKYIAAKENPKPRVYQILGSSYFRLFELDSAVYYYNEALDAEPTNIIHYLNFAEVAIMNGNFDLADSKLEQTYKMNLETVQAKGFELVVQYLLYAGQRLQNNSGEEYYDRIISLLERKDKWRLDWSFDTFIKWTKQQKINSDIKQDIEEITNRIKDAAE